MKFYDEISPIQERKFAPSNENINLEKNQGNLEDKGSNEGAVQSNGKRPMKSMNTKLTELNKRIINDVVFDQMKTRAIKSVRQL